MEGALQPQSCTARARLLAPSNSIMMSKYIKIYTFVVLTYFSQTEEKYVLWMALDLLLQVLDASLIFRVNCKIVMTMNCNHLQDDIL